MLISTLLAAAVMACCADRPQLQFPMSLAACPKYVDYSQQIHKPASTGVLALPFMRPEPSCRTFHSSPVESLIANMTAKIADPDLARLFENTFPKSVIKDRSNNEKLED